MATTSSSSGTKSGGAKSGGSKHSPMTLMLIERYGISSEPTNLSEGTLHLAYSKYKAIKDLTAKINDEIEEGTWPGKKPSLEEVCTCYASRPTWYRWEKAFQHVEKYANMEAYLEGNPVTDEQLKNQAFMKGHKEMIMGLWGMWKRNFSLGDLQKWINNAEKERLENEEKERVKEAKKAAKEKKKKEKEERKNL